MDDHIIYDKPIISPEGTEDECTPEEEANVRTQEEEASDPELIVENNNVSTMESRFQAVEKKRSLVWPKFLTFDKTKSTDGKQRSICKHCQKASFISNPHYGTQNIQRHLRKCSAYEKYLKNQGGNGSNKEYDDKEASSSFDERSILDVYLEDPKLDRKAELDILAFWKENEHRYKGRSHLARDILAVPLTTLASESTFSIGSRVLNKWKSSSIPENVEALITIRSWMYSFETNEDDGFFGSYVDWAAAPSVNCQQF